MAPRGEAFYAYGTRTTCEVQGFIATFSIVSFVAYFVILVGVREFLLLLFSFVPSHMLVPIRSKIPCRNEKQQ
jgi:hypothetical protein